jgi:class 3 adenylate cyclase
MVSCPECGRENPGQARFCHACGTPLPTVGAGSRRTVTLLFCDIARYTSIGERLDSELLHQLKWRFYSIVTQAVEAHGGSSEKFIGDAVFAAFGAKDLHEDDALRAVRAALDIRDRMAEFNAELRRDWDFEFQLRTGINTGEVTVSPWRAAGGAVTGDAVNVASRLEDAAEPGEIIIAESTQRMIRAHARTESVGPLALDGKQTPIRAYRLLGLTEPRVGPGARGTTDGFVAPMIGRDRELRRLHDALDQVVEEQTCHLFTVLGPAGIGKSRMVGEFREVVAERATVLSGRCLSYGEGITYWPLMEMVRQAIGISPDDGAAPTRARLRAVLDGLPRKASGPSAP